MSRLFTRRPRVRLGRGLPAPAAGSRLCRTSTRRSCHHFGCSPAHWTRWHLRLFNLNSFKICALRLGCTLTPRAPSPSFPLDFYTSTQNITFVKFSPPPHCIGFGCGGCPTALRRGLCFARPCSTLFTKGIFCEIECAGGLVAPFVLPPFGSGLRHALRLALAALCLSSGALRPRTQPHPPQVGGRSFVLGRAMNKK